MYNSFFKDYTEKVWGVPCSEISAEWGAQRIKGLSIRKTISHYFSKILKKSTSEISQKNIETSLIEQFLYPKFGPGQMWDVVAQKVKNQGGILNQNSKIIELNFDNKQIISAKIEDEITKQQHIVEGDYFISTMPIDELLKAMQTNVPKNVLEVSKGLQFRDFITVGLLLDKLNFELLDNWIYIQEPYVKVGRIQIFNNWSPYLVDDPTKFWVGLEYFCNIGDDLWTLDDNAIKDLAVSEMVQMGFINHDNFLDAVVIRMPKTYPAYFGTYNRFDEITEFVDKIENLFLVGRNGMHKYNNQDHSMLTAMQAVDNIKNDITTKDNIWSINTEQVYHEEK